MNIERELLKMFERREGDIERPLDMPPLLERKAKMQRMVMIAAGLVAVLALGSGGYALSQRGETPESLEPVRPQEEDAPLQAEAETIRRSLLLTGGLYRTSDMRGWSEDLIDFRHPFTFETTDDVSWRAGIPVEETVLLDLVGEGSVDFLAPTVGFDERYRPVDLPDVATWLRGHPLIDASEPQPTEVGGVAGVAFDATFRGATDGGARFSPELVRAPCNLIATDDASGTNESVPCVDLFDNSWPWTQKYRLHVAQAARFIVLDTGAPQTVIVVAAGPDGLSERWADYGNPSTKDIAEARTNLAVFLPRAEALLDTIRFEALP